MNLKKAEMGDVIKDFYKSDAPQFKGESKEKRRQMAIAAKLTAERGGRKLGEENLDELNRYEKETGKDYKTDKPSVKGGTAKDDKAFQHVTHKVMRPMQGRPQGQQKKVPGKKPPVAGQYGGPKSPAQKVAAKRAAAKRSQDNMSSRFD